MAEDKDIAQVSSSLPKSRTITSVPSQLENQDPQREEIRKALKSVETAVNQGMTVRGFLSGNHLRVVRIEDPTKGDELKGYGEHPNIDFAFVHAGEDFAAGGRSYKEQYGGIGKKGLYEYHVYGSDSTSRALDSWLQKGHKFKIYRTDETPVVVELIGVDEIHIPKDIIDEVRISAKPARWTVRGYTYETSIGPNGVVAKIIEKPEGKTHASGWFQDILKKGTGNTIAEAMINAFEAPEEEIASSRIDTIND